MDTSTPPTAPPPVSDAVPVIVTVPETVSPLPGEVIVEVGALVSVDAVAAVSPLWMLPGWTPMSASTLTVAC